MFHYFREESIRNIAKQYGWDLITPQNMADKFMKFIETMDMSYSYKPVLLKAIYEYMDSNGRVALPDVVDYFIDFYEDRKAHGMIAEKPNSIYQKGGYTRKDVEKNVLSNPFKRFEDMQMLHHTKTLGVIQVDESVWKKLTREEKEEIERKLKDDKNADLQAFREDIRKLLESEIVMRYHYYAGVARHSALRDREVRAAVALLADTARYRRILSQQDTERK